MEGGKGGGGVRKSERESETYNITATYNTYIYT
jgi:hypothetical protein